MLQQTRIGAVLGYYARFLQALPDIPSLAAASTDQLYKLWEGLGYYSRARNLQWAAQEILSRYGGQFPRDYDQIRALPGIGDYTAGAIGSICFDLPTPAVDGNVLRVISRLTADSRPMMGEKIKGEIRQALERVYPAGHCGAFTQALMELGQTLCPPKGTPDCGSCPARGFCLAAKDGSWSTLPVRGEKRPCRKEALTVFVLCCNGAYAVEKRPSTGLLAGLWQFPHVPGHLSAQQALDQAQLWQTRPIELEKLLRRTHLFTHVAWDMQCVYLRCRAKPERFIWADGQALGAEIALPTAFRIFCPEDIREEHHGK